MKTELKPEEIQMKREELYICGDSDDATYFKSEADDVMDSYEEHIKELEAEVMGYKASLARADFRMCEKDARIRELEASEYKWFDLVRDFVQVLGNDPYMVYAAIESRLKIMCDNDEIKRWNELNQSILDRLKVLTPKDWNRTYRGKENKK